LGVQTTLTFSLVDISSPTIAADTTGAKNVAVIARIPAFNVRAVVESKLQLSYTWAATADGYFALVDADTGAEIAKSSDKVGGEVAELEEVQVNPAAVAGKRVRLRIVITTAGAAGETITIRNAQLTIVMGD
jgi:hypothetical protein